MEDLITVANLTEYFSKKEFSVIASEIKPETPITGPRNIAGATENHITFLSSKFAASAESLLTTSRAAIVVADKFLYSALGEESKKKIRSYIVLSDTPKNTFVECLHHFFEEKFQPEIHPTAVIHADVKLGVNVTIGPYSVIDRHVTIGDDCHIGAHTHIMKGCSIGNRVTIRSNVTIGNWGFGFVKNEMGNNVSFPHYGSVIIEDDVQIGSSTCVDRGTLGDTIIKKGVKIDNLVHVAHNVVIGENSLVIACTMIGGSTEIGDNCWVAPAVVLRNGIRIGANSTLGMGCIVTKDIPENMTVTGAPAMPLDDFKKLMKAQKKMLDENP